MQNRKSILIISAHPRYRGLGDELAQAYLEAAKAAGHQVKLIELSKLDFDPVLHHGYKQDQPLEPDLVNAQRAITDADHLVFIYPVWWGNMPALLKGFIDRVFLPGFAFHYTNGLPEQLLKGKSARIILTMDGPNLYDWLILGRSSSKVLKEAVLKFCGFSPVRVSRIASARHMNQKKHQQLIAYIAKIAVKAQ